MITKNQSKNTYYLERDTDINELIDKMLRVKKSELFVLLKRRQNDLFEKENPGEFFSVNDTVKVTGGELENMKVFFRVVVAYFLRQEHDFWAPSIPSSMMKEAAKDIKKRVGFMKYDISGFMTEETNSITSFDLVKDLNEFLSHVEQVCFEDEGYIFPNSEYFKKLSKQKGRVQAQRQVIAELHEKHKNKFYKRETN